MDSGVGTGGTISAQGESIRISLWLCATYRDGRRNHLKLMSVQSINKQNTVYQKYLTNGYQNISGFGFDFAMIPFDKQPSFF